MCASGGQLFRTGMRREVKSEERLGLARRMRGGVNRWKGEVRREQGQTRTNSLGLERRRSLGVCYKVEANQSALAYELYPA